MTIVFTNRTATIATMHGKEKVIAPILQREFGIAAIAPSNFNTDCFGTFTRDIKRSGTQIEAAKLKAEAALILTGETLAIASEGSFFAHPLLGIPYNREIVFLLDRLNEVEIFGEELSLTTNLSHKQIKNWQEAEEFALKIGFPNHALIAIAPDGKITKGIVTLEDLAELVEQSLDIFPSEPLHLETDMRAHCNPTRMLNIEKATWDLVKKMQSLCPQCNFPGYAIAEYKSGLRCNACGIPTRLNRAAIYRCLKCSFSYEAIFPNEIQGADPQYCEFCNP